MIGVRTLSFYIVLELVEWNWMRRGTTESLGMGWSGVTICAVGSRNKGLRNYGICTVSKSSALPGRKIWATLTNKKPRPDKVVMLVQAMSKLIIKKEKWPCNYLL